MTPLRLEETVKALAFLRSRLRADTAANREALAQRHAAMEAGGKSSPGRPDTNVP